MEKENENLVIGFFKKRIQPTFFGGKLITIGSTSITLTSNSFFFFFFLFDFIGSENLSLVKSIRIAFLSVKTFCFLVPSLTQFTHFLISFSK
jgi:hypothetical protein